MGGARPGVGPYTESDTSSSAARRGIGPRSHACMTSKGSSHQNPLHPRFTPAHQSRCATKVRVDAIPAPPANEKSHSHRQKIGSGCSLRSPTSRGEQLRAPASFTKVLPVAGSVRNASVNETAARTSGSATRKAIERGKRETYARLKSNRPLGSPKVTQMTFNDIEFSSFSQQEGLVRVSALATHSALAAKPCARRAPCA